MTDPAAWHSRGDTRYAAIVFAHALEHLTEPLTALGLARKPGGNALRRSLVRRLRELSTAAAAQAFLFVAEP
jgi:hypothetical protein